MEKTLAKTLVALVLVTGLVAAGYFLFDRTAAEAAHSLAPAWRHLAKTVSLAANGQLFTVLLALGFFAGAYDALQNGLTYRSKNLLYLCTTVAAAMLAGDVLKDLFGRARPPLLFDKGEYGFFPLAGDYLHYSFPSGHSIRIFSSMTALGYVLPRLRVPALCLAVAVGLSRVAALKHYPSDVLFGAFIGITAAVWGWKILYPYGPKAGR
jgi:membrane-associated phospholipid phosphatase